MVGQGPLMPSPRTYMAAREMLGAGWKKKEGPKHITLSREVQVPLECQTHRGRKQDLGLPFHFKSVKTSHQAYISISYKTTTTTKNSKSHLCYLSHCQPSACLPSLTAQPSSQVKGYSPETHRRHGEVSSRELAKTKGKKSQSQNITHEMEKALEEGNLHCTMTPTCRRNTLLPLRALPSPSTQESSSPTNPRPLGSRTIREYICSLKTLVCSNMSQEINIAIMLVTMCFQYHKVNSEPSKISKSKFLTWLFILIDTIIFYTFIHLLLLL